MRTFHEWLNLHESMNVYVQDYDNSSDINDLDDIANKLRIKIIQPIIEKIDQNIVNNMVAIYEMIVPDGSYYSDQEQIINFYTIGWPEKEANKAIQGIKYALDEMKVKYGEFKTEASGAYNGNVVRIPVLSFSQTKNSPPMLNLSNSNAIMIFRDLLGYNYNHGDFDEISPAELLMKINNLPDYKTGIHAQEPYAQQAQGGPTIYHGGIDESGIKQRLQQIAKIAQWAVNNHYDKIYVG